MATAMGVERPPTPPTPALITGDDGRFHFICDDYDAQQPADESSSNTFSFAPDPVSPARTTPAAFPSVSGRASSTASLRPPTPDRPTFAMSDDGLASGGGAAASSGGSPAKNPFNFQTQFISTGPVKSNIGQRRGHRYKHSSISAQHQFFQEPPPRPPPVLPASLPIPTFKEAWHSMQPSQRARLWWCCCHAAVALYVFFAAQGSLALTALSHLVFFDVGSAAVCVAVDVFGNFEVWRRSSIRHPFGLQRAEVLAGFAMSIFLVFGGFDLISHNAKELLESVGHHAPHHPGGALPESAGGGHGHSHGAGRHISPGTIDTASLAAALSTLVSAYGLQNHGRIRRVMRVPLPYLSKLLPGTGILANPFHFLTLCFSFLMLLLPLVSVPYLAWLDRAMCAAIAGCMFVLGTRLAIAQGLMLLMSYSDLAPSGSDASAVASGKKMDGAVTLGDGNRNSSGAVGAVVREIEAEPNVSRVEEAQFWQVHYGLAMANLKVCLVKGCDDSTLSQMRSRLARVVQNRLGEGYGRGGNLRWEVTVQFGTDK